MSSHDARYRFVSYNVRACVGRDDDFRPDRIADLLLDLNADFIGLQEVEDRRYKGARVADYLANRLSMHLYRGATLQRDDSDYGNLLLSRLPATHTAAHKFSAADQEPRGVLEAEFNIESQRLKLFVTHLGLSNAERLSQLDRLQVLLDQEGPDIRVILGDLNEWRPFSRFRRRLERIFGRHPTPRTFPSGRPVFALDRICVSPGKHLHNLQVLRSAIASVASDHLPLYADINLQD